MSERLTMRPGDTTEGFRWYVVRESSCSSDIDDEDEKVWTLSHDPNEPGWNTDSGYGGYGLTYKLARELADAANAAWKGRSFDSRKGKEFLLKEYATEYAARSALGREIVSFLEGESRLCFSWLYRPEYMKQEEGWAAYACIKTLSL